MFDWNRLGLDGRPRELHVTQSLASIDFQDFEPKLVQAAFRNEAGAQKRWLVNDPLFNVEVWKLPAGTRGTLPPGKLQIVAVTAGEIQIHSTVGPVGLSAGQFALIPACLPQSHLTAGPEATLLRVEAN